MKEIVNVEDFIDWNLFRIRIFIFKVSNSFQQSLSKSTKNLEKGFLIILCPIIEIWPPYHKYLIKSFLLKIKLCIKAFETK